MIMMPAHAGTLGSRGHESMFGHLFCSPWLLLAVKSTIQRQIGNEDEPENGNLAAALSELWHGWRSDYHHPLLD